VSGVPKLAKVGTTGPARSKPGAPGVTGLPACPIHGRNAAPGGGGGGLGGRGGGGFGRDGSAVTMLLSRFVFHRIRFREFDFAIADSPARASLLGRLPYYPRMASPGQPGQGWGSYLSIKGYKNT